MVLKVFLLCVVVQLVYVFAGDKGNVVRTSKADILAEFSNFGCTPTLKKIQDEMFWRTSVHTQGLWNVTPPEHNIQFFPILDAISKSMKWIYIYHNNRLVQTYTKEDFLEIPHELAKQVRKIQYSVENSTSDHPYLRFKNALFYDKFIVSKEYVDDIAEHFDIVRNPEPAKKNAFIIKMAMHNFLMQHTKGRDSEEEFRLTPGLSDYHISILHFSACWNMPMVKNNDLLFKMALPVDALDKQHEKWKVFVQNPTLKFNPPIKSYLEAFTSKGLVGYFNDSEAGFEALRLLFNKDKFAVAFLLPHQNRTLEMFLNFTAQDNERILDRLNATSENIEFLIPALDIDMVTMNAIGTVVNVLKPLDCNPLSQNSSLDSEPSYKKFEVDRPYGALVYHVATKFVLWHGWIRDPTSVDYVFRRFTNHTRIEAKLIDETSFW